MRILLIHNSYREQGGEDGVVLSEMALLQSQKHEVEFFQIYNKQISGVFQKIRTALEATYSSKSKKFISVEIKRFQPDIVHVHNFFPLITPSVYDACLERRIPVVQTLHNYRTICSSALLMRGKKVCEDCIFASPYQAVFHRCYRNSLFGSFVVARMVAHHRKRKTWQTKVDRLITLSDFAKKKFIEAGFSEKNITVKPNYYHNRNAANKPDSRFNDTYALFVGRLSHEKGVTTLITAWNKVNIPLKIAGDGPLIIKEAEVHNSSNIKLLGKVSHKQVSKEMSGANFLVMPSECYENFPLVLVEAFAHGLPVVASRLGSMAEIVEDGITGLHFEPGNPRDLAEKARWMFEHPEECRRMGENARKVYEEKYTPEINYQQLMTIYRNVIEEYKHGKV